MGMVVDHSVLKNVSVAMNLKSLLQVHFAHLNRRSTPPSVQYNTSKGISVAPQVKPGVVMEGCPSRSLRLNSDARCINLNFPAGVVAVADCQGLT